MTNIKVPSSTKDKVIDYIRTYSEENNMPPSVHDISRELGKSPSTILYHLQNLTKQQILIGSDKQGTNRAYRLTSHRLVDIKILKSVCEEICIHKHNCSGQNLEEKCAACALKSFINS